MSTPKRSAVMGTLAELLTQVQQLKAAEAHSEPGSVGGETEHPIKKVDDNSEDAQEGSRSAENTKDVKEDQGPMGVEQASKEAGKAKAAAKTKAAEGAGGGQEATNSDPIFGPLDGGKSTGKDPSVETSSVKGNKEDGSIGGKTTHPATTEDGKKYGSVSEQLADLCKQADSLGQSILSAILKSSQANGAKPAEKKADEGKKEGAANGDAKSEGTEKTAEGEEKKEEEKEETEKAAQAGYDLAGIFADLDVPTTDKVACDQVVLNRIKNASQHGVRMADALAEYYRNFFAQKQAEEEGEPPAHERGESREEESEESKGDESNGGGAPPSGNSGGTPPLGDQAMPSEEELLAMLGGMGGGGGDAGGLGAGGGDAGAGGLPGAGGGGGGGGGLPGAGGGLPAAGGAGGDAGGLAALLGGGGGAGAGGMPPGAGGGMPGAGGAPGAGGSPGDEALLMQLIQELGLDPSAVEAKAAAAIRQKRASAAKKPLDKQAEQRKAAMKKMLLDLVGSGK